MAATQNTNARQEGQHEHDEAPHNGEPTPDPGFYHRLVKDMSWAKSIAIFRRFEEVNLLQLLSLQAEIIHWEEQFKLQCETDRKQKKTYERDFFALRQSKPKPKPVKYKCEHCNGENVINQTSSPIEGTSQYEILQTLGEKVGKYNALMLQVSQLARLDSPPKSQLEYLQDRLKEKSYKLEEGQGQFPPAAEFYTWRDRDERKYYSLNISDAEKDAFTDFIKGTVLTIFNLIFGEKFFKKKAFDPESQLFYYEDSKLDTASGIISLIIASIMPVLTIYVLNALTTTAARIGLTALFTAIFSFLLVRFTSAKRVEIFAATATFAAVEVVFIGSALNTN